ncbi:MAG: hypothetical protein WC284_15295 [Candidimonas sp.]
MSHNYCCVKGDHWWDWPPITLAIQWIALNENSIIFVKPSGIVINGIKVQNNGKLLSFRDYTNEIHKYAIEKWGYWDIEDAKIYIEHPGWKINDSEITIIAINGHVEARNKTNDEIFIFYGWDPAAGAGNGPFENGLSEFVRNRLTA